MANCSSCGAGFSCGLRETDQPCWCAALPLLNALDPAGDCLCPTCLAARLSAQAVAAATADHDAG